MTLAPYGCLALAAVVLSAGSAAGAAEGLFFREDTRDTPPALPITQEHVANPGLVLRLYGPGKAGVKKSYHETTKNDPHYIWSGQCQGRWAVAFEKKGATADLSAADAQIRLRTKNQGRTVYVILKTPDGWLVSNEGAGPSAAWRRTVLNVKDLSWSRLEIDAVTRGPRVEAASLKRVVEIGFTDLEPGGGSKVCSRVDWIEVWQHLPKRPLHVVGAADGWQFYDGQKPVLFYHTGSNTYKGRHARANYVHPLMGLRSEVLTEDFPDDHPHHRGVFWAWHQVLVGGKSVGDSWSCQGIVWDVRGVKVLSDPSGSAAIEADVHWKSARWQGGKKPFLAETATIRVHRVVDGARAVDFRLALRALADDVKIGGAENDKGYGGFCTRIVTPRDLAMTGPKGAVTPKLTPVAAGGWLSFTGTFGRAASGLAVLVHPGNPGYPQPWILRKQRSCQNAVYPGRHAAGVPSDRPLVLRYRLLIHENADVAKHFAEWCKGKAGGRQSGHRTEGVPPRATCGGRGGAIPCAVDAHAFGKDRRCHCDS